jgi:hypothetical protein
MRRNNVVFPDVYLTQLLETVKNQLSSDQCIAERNRALPFGQILQVSIIDWEFREVGISEP